MTTQKQENPGHPNVIAMLVLALMPLSVCCFVAHSAIASGGRITKGISATVCLTDANAQRLLVMALLTG